jgi:hypothetical protein
MRLVGLIGGLIQQLVSCDHRYTSPQLSWNMGRWASVARQLFHQPGLAGDAVQITNEQNAQQQLGINRRSASVAVTSLMHAMVSIASSLLRFRGRKHRDGGLGREQKESECLL